jgi:hypothetical protein
MDTNTDTIEIKKKGRPRKYATTEEAHQAHLIKMKEYYAKKIQNKEIINKNKLSGDELRAKANERLKRWRQKKKDELLS